MEKKTYLEIAKIINTHGVRGAVKLDPWCDSPDMLKKIKKLYLENGACYDVSDVKMIGGGFVVCSLSGITTVEAAVKLKNKILLAKREDIPVEEGSFFICDLIGLPVKDAESGVTYGVIEDVIQNTVQDIYSIKTESGKTVLLPAVPAFVKTIDTENAVYITPIAGFFDEAEEVRS